MSDTPPIAPPTAGPGFSPQPPKKRRGPLIAALAVVLALAVAAGVFFGVVRGGGDESATATTSTTAGPVLDVAGVEVSEAVLDAFEVGCRRLQLDGDVTKFCGCARTAVPAQASTAEIETATEVFLGASGRIPNAIRSAMASCTAGAKAASTTPTTGS